MEGQVGTRTKIKPEDRDRTVAVEGWVDLGTNLAAQLRALDRLCSEAKTGSV